MRRFEFRVAKLLRLREQRQRQAELHQQQVQGTLERARLEVARLQLEFEAASSAAHVPGVLSVGTWVARALYAQRLGQELALAETGADQALQQLREASALRAKCTAEVDVLLLLRDRQWQQHRHDTEQAEQARLDELGIRRWRACQGEHGPGNPNLSEGTSL